MYRWLTLLIFAAPQLAFAGREVLSIPLSFNTRFDGTGRFFSLKIAVNLQNLSTAPQTVSIYVDDVTFSNTINVGDVVEGRTLYSEWQEHSNSPGTRTRNIPPVSFSKLDLTIPNRGFQQVPFIFNCRLDNVGGNQARNPPTCATDNTNSNFTVPAPVTGMESNASMRFRIKINEDRGAVLASYSVLQITGLGRETYAREFNGGRPF